MIAEADFWTPFWEDVKKKFVCQKVATYNAFAIPWLEFPVYDKKINKKAVSVIGIMLYLIDDILRWRQNELDGV